LPGNPSVRRLLQDKLADVQAEQESRAAITRSRPR
jgi:hypothetical protein